MALDDQRVHVECWVRFIVSTQARAGGCMPLGDILQHLTLEYGARFFADVSAPFFLHSRKDTLNVYENVVRTVFDCDCLLTTKPYLWWEILPPK